MLQTKESLRLLPEQKTFLLPSGRYKADSLENMNQTLIKASDAMDLVYKQLYGTVTYLTKLDDECSKYQGNIEVNLKLIAMATMADQLGKKFDQLLTDANPGVKEVSKVG